jgi:hypothetical protein
VRSFLESNARPTNASKARCAIQRPRKKAALDALLTWASLQPIIAGDASAESDKVRLFMLKSGEGVSMSADEVLGHGFGGP